VRASASLSLQPLVGNPAANLTSINVFNMSRLRKNWLRQVSDFERSVRA
jgi:hypothetical protein